MLKNFTNHKWFRNIIICTLYDDSSGCSCASHFSISPHFPLYILDNHTIPSFVLVTNLPTLLQAILSGFLSEFSQAVKDCAGQIVDAAVEIYDRLSVDLLPTPAKSHYVFNLRDLSKCVQGET